MFALVALALLAADPTACVSAPATAAAGDLVILDATASVGDVFLWESLDGVPCLPVDGGRKCVFASGKPGAYRFLFLAAGIVGARPAVAAQRITVTIEAPAPPPPPDPNTTPPAPTPQPTMSGKLYATLVFSEAGLAPPVAGLRADPSLGSALAQLDCQWSEVESASAEFKDRNLGAATRAHNLPVVVVQANAHGNPLEASVVAVFPATSSTEVLSRIKALRGKP